MKARFSQPQLPVKTVAAGDKTYIFICLNETQGTESFPDMGEGQTTETYYEYDYNEIVGPTNNLPLGDIQAHPENYRNLLVRVAGYSAFFVDLEESIQENIIERTIQKGV